MSENNNSSVGSRLCLMLNKLNKSQTAFSREIGISKNAMSNYVNDNRIPDTATSIKIARALDVNIEWLLTGCGSRDRQNLTLLEDEFLLNNYRLLTKEGKARILERINVLLEDTTTKLKNSILIDFDSIETKEQADIRVYEQAKTAFEATEQIKRSVYELPASAGLGNYLYEDSPHEILTFNREDIPAKANFGIRIQGDSMEPEIMDGSIAWVRERRQIETGKIGIFIYNNEAYCKKLHLDYENKKVYLVSINEKYPPIEIENENFLKTVGEVLK